MTMPDFLVIGGAKSGTTALYHYLKQHPEIYMSPIKEPQFFALEGRGIDFRGPSRSTVDPSFVPPLVTTLEEYQALFDAVTDQKAVGEVSPWYLYFPQAPERIRRYLPDARLIAVLRNPVERAFSAYLHAVQWGLEPVGDFAEALRLEPERIRDNWWPFFHYKQRGFYSLQLQRYYDRFPADRIRIYLYEDFTSDPVAMLRDIFRYLGVDESFTPDTARRHNVTLVPKSRRLDRFLSGAGPLKAVIKPLLPEGLRRRLTGRLQRLNLTRPTLGPALRQHLIEEYRDDILRLQDMVGRDLSLWLR